MTIEKKGKDRKMHLSESNCPVTHKTTHLYLKIETSINFYEPHSSHQVLQLCQVSDNPPSITLQ